MENKGKDWNSSMNAKLGTAAAKIGFDKSGLQKGAVGVGVGGEFDRTKK